MRDPAVVWTPRVEKRSFTATGTPSSGERRSPRAARASASQAAARAWSPVTVRKAPSLPFTLAMRARAASVSSSDEVVRAASASPASRIVRAVSSGGGLTR